MGRKMDRNFFSQLLFKSLEGSVWDSGSKNTGRTWIFFLDFGWGGIALSWDLIS